MKPELQQVAIAKACGWTTRPNGFQRFFVWVNPDGHDVGKSNHEAHMETAVKDLPDYLNDLNAMHEAEEYLRLDQFSYTAYWRNLFLVVSGKAWTGDIGYFHFEMVHANATQRADAFILTRNLWEP